MKRRTKQIFVSGIVGVLLIGLWFFLRHKIQGFKDYVDPKKQFKIVYPKTWEISKNSAGANVLFLSPQDSDIDLFRENVSVVVQDLGNNKLTNLADYSYTAVDQVVAVFGENVEVLENNPLVTLDKRAAHRFVFLGKGPGVQYKYLMIWTISRDRQKAYQVTYAGVDVQFDRFLDEAEKMISSFTILK